MTKTNGQKLVCRATMLIAMNFTWKIFFRIFNSEKRLEKGEKFSEQCTFIYSPIHYLAFFSQPYNKLSFFHRGSCWLFMFVRIPLSLSLCVSSTFNHIHICSGSSLALISSQGFIDIRSLTHSLSLSVLIQMTNFASKRFRIDNDFFLLFVVVTTENVVLRIVFHNTDSMCMFMLCISHSREVFVYVSG